MRRPKYTWIGLTTVIMLLLARARISAQAYSSSSPLFFMLNGDIVSYTPANGLKQLTHWGHNDSPMPSADGRYIAYRSTTQRGLDLAKQPGAGLDIRDIPANIWVLDTQTGNNMRVGDQPPPDKNALYDLDRGVPVWSLTGDTVAWVEAPTAVSSGGDSAPVQLITYDMTNQTKRTLVPDLGKDVFMRPGPGRPVVGFHLAWGKTGIAVRGFATTVYVYDTTARLLSQVDTGGFTLDTIWVEDGAREYLANLHGDSATQRATDWQYIDPQTWKPVSLSKVPELYSLTASQNLSMAYTAVPQTDKNQGGWYLVTPGQGAKFVGDSAPMGADQGSLQPYVAISPDGKAVAYRALSSVGGLAVGGQIAVYTSDGTATTFSDFSPSVAIAWGGVGWRLDQITPIQQSH